MPISFATIVRDSVLAVIHRPLRCLLIGAATLAVVLAGWSLAPRSYSSEAKLFVRVGRETVTLDPTATTGQTIAIYEARETELNSALDILTSRAVHEMVVDRLSPAVVLGTVAVPAQVPPLQRPERGLASIASDGPPTSPVSVTAPVEPPVNHRAQGLTQREQAIQSLAKLVSVAQGKKSGVITMTAKSTSPELAQRILEATVDCFLMQHLRMNRTVGSHEFFVEQVELGRAQLHRAAEELRQAKNKLGVTSIEGHRKLLQDQLTVLSTARVEADSTLASSEATARELRKSLNRVPAQLVSQEVTGLAGDGRDRTRQQLSELELRERQLLTKFTAVHPEVIAVREQLTRAKEMLASRDEAAQRTRVPNPIAQQLEVRLTEEDAKAAAARARAEVLAADTRAVMSRLETLNASEGEIQRLEKQTETLQAGLKTYVEKTEQARIHQALEAERISNVNIVQPPSLSAKSNSPSGKTVGLLGVVLAVLSGVGLPLGWELGRRGGPPLLAILSAPPGEA